MQYPSIKSKAHTEALTKKLRRQRGFREEAAERGSREERNGLLSPPGTATVLGNEATTGEEGFREEKELGLEEIRAVEAAAEQAISKLWFAAQREREECSSLQQQL